LGCWFNFFSFLFFLSHSQRNPVLYLCQCPWLAGPVGFLTWGIVFWVLFDSFILWPYNALDSLLWGNDIFVSADIWHLYKELYPWMEALCLLQPYRYVTLVWASGKECNPSSILMGILWTCCSLLI
jgi:hypothetical protein